MPSRSVDRFEEVRHLRDAGLSLSRGRVQTRDYVQIFHEVLTVARIPELEMALCNDRCPLLVSYRVPGCGKDARCIVVPLGHGIALSMLGDAGRIRAPS